MQSYRCRVCGYIYEPGVGDRLRGIAPGTLFDQLPGGWTCPVCGASQDDFEPVQPLHQQPRPGRYRHFKGNRYQLLGIAKHSETMEDMAVYRALKGDQSLWVRPLHMWQEQVLVDGHLQPRFQTIEDDAPEA